MVDGEGPQGPPDRGMLRNIIMLQRQVEQLGHHPATMTNVSYQAVRPAAGPAWQQLMGVPSLQSGQQSTGAGVGVSPVQPVCITSHFHHIYAQIFQFSLMINISRCLHHVRVAVLGALITCFHLLATNAMGRASSLGEKMSGHQDILSSKHQSREPGRAPTPEPTLPAELESP